MENCLLIILRQKFEPIKNIKKISKRFILIKLVSARRFHGIGLRVDCRVKGNDTVRKI